MSFDLSDYVPEKISDGVELIKGKGNAGFNYARIEEYEGKKSLNYELQICDHPEHSSRRLWGKIYFDGFKDKGGKTPIERFRDITARRSSIQNTR